MNGWLRFASDSLVGYAAVVVPARVLGIWVLPKTNCGDVIQAQAIGMIVVLRTGFNPIVVSGMKQH